MFEPADVLFLDEPTNDLDIPTLELIEESLSSFAGAVVLISHDRCLMDRICNKVLSLGENEHQFFASYSQWESSIAPPPKKEKAGKKEAAPIQKESSSKLTYKEKKELESMEQSIHQVEAQIEKLQGKLNGEEGSLETYQHLGRAHEQLEHLYQRWQFLLDKSK